jgi:uncharacterized protein
MGATSSNIRDLVYYQRVSLPSEYATQVLDKNHTGLISIQQISKDPVLRYLLVPYSVVLTFLRTNNTMEEAITVVPNNEVRALNIFYKYIEAPE